MSSRVPRREFLRRSSTVGAGLVIAFCLPRHIAAYASAPADFRPNAFLEITPEGRITIWCAKSEMGQGVRTSLPMIVAEELCCSWQAVQIAQADLDPKYGDQLTGGSLSVRTSYESLRKAGAAAREMLIAAAAGEWQVPASECSAKEGMVVHTATRRALPFAQLVERAAAQPPPSQPALKQPEQFQIIGKPIPRSDTFLKITGAARFGIDVRVPGMLVASVERCPVYGGTARTFDAVEARKSPGVKAVFEIKPVHLTHQFGDESGPGSRNYTCGGVAVVADSTWNAMRARKLLKVEWNEGTYAAESTESLRKQFLDLARQPGARIRNDGDVHDALATAAKTIEATYEVPFLAHATMEPMNCTAHVHDGMCEIWAPTQIPGAAAASIAQALGVSQDKVRVHVTFLGGGFGRRLIQDYAVEAALIAKEAGAPVQVVWSREDDVQHDFYRPAAYHSLRAGLDAHGNAVAWYHHACSPSIDVFYSGTGLTPQQAAQVSSLEFPALAIRNFRLEFSLADSGMPLGYWRSVENSGNQFVISSFLDELAHAAGRDSVEFLLATLGPARKIDLRKDMGSIDIGRRRRVIELAAEKADWGKPLAKGSGRGIAAHFGYGSYVAQVAEVHVDEAQKQIRVHRVFCAIDCGQPINPTGAKAQMESAINFGLAATLRSAITVARGRVQQSNFHDYEVLRMNEAPPAIDVHIIPSKESPGGCGEPGVPPIAPAVANAVFAATGKRLRRLPLRLDG